MEELEDMLCSDLENEVSQAWNEQRKLALSKAIEGTLLPEMERELRSELAFEARENLADTYRERFAHRIMRGPYSIRGAMQTQPGLPPSILERESNRGVKVMACVWDRDLKVHKDPTPVTCVLLGRDGQHKDTLELPFMQLPDQDQRKKDSVKMLQEFIKRQEPDVVVLGTNGRTSETLYQIIGAAFYKLQEENIQMPKAEFIDDEAARIYQHSKRAEAELPDSNTLVRLAIGVARLAHDPLSEMANILAEPSDFGQLMVHPLQDMLSVTERLRLAEECAVDATNAFGIELNTVVASKHNAALLRYVSGLGPRKAKAIFTALGNATHEQLWRAGLENLDLVGTVVFKSCGGFVRIDHDRLRHEDVDERSDLKLLDSSLIHMDDYDLATDMAVNAMDVEIPEEPDDDDERVRWNERRQELQFEAVRDIRKQPERLEQLDLEAYAQSLVAQEGYAEAVGPQELAVATARRLASLNEIKSELIKRFYDRQAPWRPLDGAELFQAICGFQGRDIFIGEAEESYYEGEIDQKQAYIQLDCQLRARLSQSEVEENVNVPFDAPPSQRFQFGVPRHYMVKSCVVSEPERGDRFYIDVTRKPRGYDQYNPGLDSSIEYACGILCDPRFSLSLENAEDSKSKKQQRYARQITHPDFQNVNFASAKRWLEGKGAGSDFLFRPSGKGRDHLTLTIQFFEEIYINIDVLERNKTETSAVGSPLVIDGEEFDDLDEVIFRYVHPFVDQAREMINYRKFTDMSKEQILARMKEDLQGGAKQSYYLTVNRDPRYPGRFCLFYMRKGKHQMEDVKCSHKGLRFRNEYHGHPERLTAFFKQNFNRPIPPKKSDRPAPVPEQPRVVKKEEPRDFTVKDEAPSMDIKPTPQQLGVSSFQNQVRMLSSYGFLSSTVLSLSGWVVTAAPAAAAAAVGAQCGV